MVDAFWLLFIVASLALIAVPGQDMILVMSRSIAQGSTAGVITAAGVSVGLVGHAGLATLGLGVILRTSELLFVALKLVGAAYPESSTKPRGSSLTSLVCHRHIFACQVGGSELQTAGRSQME
jgi:LysE type translocator